MRRRALIAVAGSILVLVAVALPASAHVSVDPGTAATGSFTKLAFRVPTESETAATVKVEVQFPDPGTAPLASASVQPHAGWSYQVVKTHLRTPVKSDDGDVTDVVSTITWTASSADAGIKPGEFDEFDVAVGPLPERAGSLVFKTVQTYSDGSVVRWIEPGEAAEHPAPVLKVAPATTAGASPTASARAAKRDADRARTTGIIGIVVGALGLLVAIAALVTARTRRASDAT